MYTEYIGTIIKQRRKEQHISQECLGEFSKVSKQTISNIESGESETSYIVFLRICDFLSIDPREILHLIKILDETHAESVPE